jgi:hypothetical protein
MGWNYPRILAFYFPGTTLETLQPQMIALEWQHRHKLYYDHRPRNYNYDRNWS